MALPPSDRATTAERREDWSQDEVRSGGRRIHSAVRSKGFLAGQNIISHRAGTVYELYLPVLYYSSKLTSPSTEPPAMTGCGDLCYIDDLRTYRNGYTVVFNFVITKDCL